MKGSNPGIRRSPELPVKRTPIFPIAPPSKDYLTDAKYRRTEIFLDKAALELFYRLSLVVLATSTSTTPILTSCSASNNIRLLSEIVILVLSSSPHICGA